jgi:hypothetical protein
MQRQGEPKRVSGPATPRDRSLPQDGDLVVTLESKSAVRFIVRQVPGVVQFSASSRDEAVRIARGLAQKHSVDLWYSEHDTCRLLEAYRRRGSSRG